MSNQTGQFDPNAERRIIHVEWEGRTKYTYYDDGIVKITRYRGRRIYWGRIFAALIVFVLLCMGIVQLIKTAVGAVKNDRSEIKANASVFPSASSDTDDSFSPPSSADDSSLNSTEDGSSPDEPDADYANMNIKVCIDPGHGDYDKGTVASDGMVESEQNLEIALLVKEYLEKCGVSVVMTREDDTAVSLAERCTIANQASADFFVSLHRNSLSNTDSGENGVEIWVNNLQPQYDTVLANNIMSALESAGISYNRGVKFGYVGMPDQNYQVNMDTVMPSCLVELGFVTNDNDNQLFEEKKSDYAKSIGDAIIKTAVELNVVSEDGTRLLNEQLLSDGKSNVNENY